MEPMEVLRRAIQTRLGERMVSMSSTLVETVSINYEDFNESFLTCGTCLCMYDGSEHTPKLLQCSHTVCLHCLTRIAASQTRDTGTFRCPICRELITIPRGGVSALPPSFLVNQLLDLMSRQRREVIPKCSVHINQELLFCETCDTVFCTMCTEGSHNDVSTTGSSVNVSGSGTSAIGTNSGTSCEHTIIPFSIAIKRMSEILLYKANECISKLTQAQDGVNSELERLDSAAGRCIEQVNSTFQQVTAALENRRLEMIAAVNNSCQEKRRVLEEQQSLIDAEKNKVEQECDGLQYQVEVRNITQRISSLSEKLDTASTLGEPRENAFLTCDFIHNDSLNQIQSALKSLGRVRTSTTFPSLCSAQLDSTSNNGQTVAGLEAMICLTTVDYHGTPRHNGGDPVKAEIMSIGTDQSPLATGNQLKTQVIDLDDGSYKIVFRPPTPGRYVAKISVLDRPIRDCPLYFNVTEHNNPIGVYGSRGSGKDEFLQPVAIAYNLLDNCLYIVDTGNSRIKVLTSDLEFVRHLENDGLNGRSCTGIAVTQAGLIIVNWRSKMVTELTIHGETLKQFSHNEFQEPIDIAVDRNYGHILVADNGLSCIFVFDCDGKLLFQVGKKGTFNLISSVAVGLDGEILVADSRIQVFSAKGDFTDEIFSEGRGKGKYGGITVDNNGRILASRSEKGRNFVQILALNDSSVCGIIDSNESRLKRPSGLAVVDDNHFLIVVDLGNDCVKKYRYW